MKVDRIHELIEYASSFGSAGIFIILAFGLFTRIGGSWSAIAAMAAGTATWAALEFAVQSEVKYPYLSSLLAALLAYLGVALVEWLLARSRKDQVV